MNYEANIIKAANAELQYDEDVTVSNRKPAIIAALIALLMLAATAGYYFYNKAPASAAAAGAEDAAKAQNVTIVSPGSDTVATTINATGTIAARQDTAVGVVGEGGQVARVFVQLHARSPTAHAST